ncbi:tetratricopeptide repeat protein [Paenibacillus sp. GCM10012303]|jgi:tetratricopeptide (TPR) repeat protein|uniref:tetratricopeptide repeat protein n=1 Tax=Paenibacillus sp. GCM10012303 TaxID=3317340 RepID=UPI00360BC92A
MDGDNPIKKAYASILEADFERAIEWFEQAIREEPDNADYHYKLSVTFARSNRLGKAIEHALRAKQLEPGSDVYSYHLDTLQAKLLMQDAQKVLDGTDRTYLAVPLLTRAIELDPLSVEAHMMLSAAYAALQEYGKAVQMANETLRLDPEHPDAKRLAEEYRQQLKMYLQTQQTIREI